MSIRSLSLFALGAFVAAAAATPAMAGSCCGCGYGCAPPPQIQIWGLAPSFVVNQGPVYSGPGFYTSPTYEGETLTSDYPYVGWGDYPRYRYETEPFRHYEPYRLGALPERPRHFTTLRRHETDVVYRPGFGRRAITMSSAGHRADRNSLYR
jgi:hypothetical protein